MTPIVGGTPRQWAVVTTKQIVEAGAGASPQAFALIALIRQKIAGALMLTFLSVRLDPTPERILSAAEAATNDILTIVASTPWSTNFSEPTIRQAIQDRIAQNLTSASAAP
jgi:hypothetical protein